MDRIVKHLFIINPKSFSKISKQNQVVSKIHQFFRGVGDSEYDIYVSRFPRDAVGFIPLFARNLPDTTILRVYAVGGDGILFDCLNGIMGLENVELAAIPYGYTNNFVRGFDKNDRASFRRISRQYNAPAIPVDIMRCGSNYALNYCVIGLEAEAVYCAEKLRERMERGPSPIQWLCKRLYNLSFFVGGLAACGNKQMMHQRYEIDIDGEKFSGSCQGFSIFNGSYYGGNLHPLSNAMPNDGILDMLSVQSQGALQTFCLFPFYTSGHYKTFPRNFILKQGKKVSIRSDNTLRISMDGIVFFESEIEVEVLPSEIMFVDASKHGYRGASQ